MAWKKNPPHAIWANPVKAPVEELAEAPGDVLEAPGEVVEATRDDFGVTGECIFEAPATPVAQPAGPASGT